MAEPFALVLDTSAILLPFEKGIDLEKEADRMLPGAELIVPRPILDELAHVAAEGKGSARRHAKAALTYVLRFDEYKIGGKGDDTVIQTGRRLEAEGYRVGIATVDQRLRQRARSKGWPVLTVKGYRAYVDGFVE